MGLRQWLLAGALVAAGCAHAVPDSAVARLPADDRAQIVTAQQSIEVADANLRTAKQSRDEARQFRKMAMNELDAARARLDAARSGIALGQHARDDEGLRQSSRNEELATNEVVAARAKLDYGDKLVELREARVDEAEAERTAARADVDATKLHLLQQRELAGRLDARAIEARRQDAAERLADKRARVADLEGETAQLKVAWEDRARESRVASARGVIAPQPLAVPPPATPSLPMPQNWQDRPRGDVNDTPAAPETPRSQETPNNMAPAP